MSPRSPQVQRTVPGRRLCYAFAFHKRKQGCLVYKCISCCRARRHVQIDVIGNDFLEDPCALPHNCLPKKAKKNFVERFMYKKLQEIRNDPNFADAVIRKVWQDVLDAFPQMPDFSLEEVREIMDEFHQEGYSKRRRTILKSVQMHDRPTASLDDVPENLRTLKDGTTFLQFSSPGLYIYYSKTTIQKAVENGLTALVADGVHKLPPKALGDDGQLYTVHGVCNGGIDVPLVHVLTRRKNESVYDKVFGMIKQELTEQHVDCGRIRIIIDFERAALVGIKNHFPEGCVEGCSFHLAQAWNRKALSLGLRAEMKEHLVRDWWMTLKGLIFLPPRLHRRVPALHGPPVPPTHPAYRKCMSFLAYLHENWYAGPFKNIWYKWGKSELRTSNVAESYHRVLRVLIRERNAPVRKTLKCLHGADNRAMCTLRNLERGIARKLRRKDILRRERIDRCMEEHRPHLEHPSPATESILVFNAYSHLFLMHQSLRTLPNGRPFVT
ncbi:unnamed protein product [Cylicostephanus goldi]|uniref:MULE transposase domain-containing protein n=1 Tax=Cylicostephanus goldi TaxID=71465 RepID=A0A3P7PNI1_CYLGO|nr:unnamed protein product [Cylicostephanus goldi]